MHQPKFIFFSYYHTHITQSLSIIWNRLTIGNPHYVCQLNATLIICNILLIQIVHTSFFFQAFIHFLSKKTSFYDTQLFWFGNELLIVIWVHNVLSFSFYLCIYYIVYGFINKNTHDALNNKSLIIMHRIYMIRLKTWSEKQISSQIFTFSIRYQKLF